MISPTDDTTDRYKDRDLAILAAYDSGQLLREIGKKFNLSMAQVYQIAKRCAHNEGRVIKRQRGPRGKKTGWAVRRADGLVVAELGPNVTEDWIWTLALGWPTPEEIKWEKKKGGRAFRCRLVEIYGR